MVLRNILSGPFDDEGGAQGCKRKNAMILVDRFIACHLEWKRKPISMKSCKQFLPRILKVSWLIPVTRWFRIAFLVFHESIFWPPCRKYNLHFTSQHANFKTCFIYLLCHTDVKKNVVYLDSALFNNSNQPTSFLLDIYCDTCGSCEILHQLYEPI